MSEKFTCKNCGSNIGWTGGPGKWRHENGPHKVRCKKPELREPIDDSWISAALVCAAKVLKTQSVA